MLLSRSRWSVLCRTGIRYNKRAQTASRSRTPSCTCNHHQLNLEHEIQSRCSEPVKLKKRPVALHIGYVGTGLRGLQATKRNDDEDTVEAVLEAAILAAGFILPSNYGDFKKIHWRRSSRTDKGVHSLCTVIGLRMLVDEGSLQPDPEGQAAAAAINAHLPPAIRVFSCQLVNPSFNPRDFCNSRTYVLSLPLSTLGAALDASGELTQEGRLRLQAFRAALQLYMGRHAFHNFAARRSQYRLHSGAAAGQQQLPADEAVQQEGGQGQCSQPEDAALSVSTATAEERPAARTVSTPSSSSSPTPALVAAHDVEGLQPARHEPGSSTRNGRTAAGDGSSIHGDGDERQAWLQTLRFNSRVDAADRVVAAHYRTVTACSASEPRQLLPGGRPCICVEVCASSFMLHQIRHMLGAAAAAARGVLPQELLEAALSPAVRVSLPRAPPHTLLLTAAEFSPFYKEGEGQAGRVVELTGDRLRLREQGSRAQASYHQQVVLPALDALLDHPDWDAWADSLDRYSYPGPEVQLLVQQHAAWRAGKQAEARAKAAAKASRAPAITLAPALTAALSKARLQVVRVLEARDVPGSQHLLCCMLDTGQGGRRQALLGIRPHYTAADLAGRLCAAVTNVRPARLAGLLSDAMLLAAVARGEQEQEGAPLQVCLLQVPAGSQPGEAISPQGVLLPSRKPHQLNPVAWQRLAEHLQISAGSVTCSGLPLTTMHGAITVSPDFPSQARIEG